MYWIFTTSLKFFKFSEPIPPCLLLHFHISFALQEWHNYLLVIVE